MRNKTSSRLPYGSKKGKLLHISEVSRGLACGCVCPACGDRLVARKGTIREHHFAHAAGNDCRTAVETALHLAAKEVLERRKEIVLPSVEIQFHFHRYRTSGDKSLILAPERRYQLTSVALERRLSTIVPDVLAHVENRPLLIEIRVTHGIKARKLARIQNLDMSTVEIDLSAVPRDLTWKDLEEMVVESATHKQWIYNAVAEQRRRRILARATVRDTIDRGGWGLPLHVDGCPLPARVWRGKPYANVIDDCVYCEHAFEIEDGHVICGG